MTGDPDCSPTRLIEACLQEKYVECHKEILLYYKKNYLYDIDFCKIGVR